MTNIPSNPKTTGKVLASEFPTSKTAAITIKMIPTNSAIFWNIMLHILISPRTLYKLSLERISICHNWRELQENRLTIYYFRVLVLYKLGLDLGLNFNLSLSSLFFVVGREGVLLKASKTSFVFANLSHLINSYVNGNLRLK